MTLQRILSPAVLCVALALSGCDDDGAKAQQIEAEEEAAPRSNVKVELPPPPNFDEGKVDEQYADGAWSIYGLRRNLDEQVEKGKAGEEITIKGFVQEIYVPPECPEGEMCPPPKQPHFWITDKPEEKGKKRAMMIVNYRFTIPEWDAKRWKGEPEVLIELGKQYSIKGKFKRFSDTGFADDRGLLEFVAYKPYDPETGQQLEQSVFPPGAPWHPIELARVEEEQRELAEKAAKTAVDYKNRDE